MLFGNRNRCGGAVDSGAKAQEEDLSLSDDETENIFELIQGEKK